MDPVNVEIISDGKHLIKHTKNGKNYFEVPESGDYIIRIRNNTFWREEIVVSVDGLSVMDGEEASFNTRGFVVPGCSYIDIIGWHRTDDDVASFTFDKKKASYSAQIGKGTDNVGVIGVAVFEDRVLSYWNPQCLPYWISPDIPYWDPPYLSIGEYFSYGDDGSRFTCTTNSHQTLAKEVVHCENADATHNINEANLTNEVDSLTDAQYNIGTGYGKEEPMKVTRIAFERASLTPNFVTSYRYASRPTLVKWGVITEKPTQPNPFPGNKVACKAPPGWKG